MAFLPILKSANFTKMRYDLLDFVISVQKIMIKEKRIEAIKI